jgi:hypothetical protein
MAHTKGRLIYILLHQNQVIGTWSNLKHLCNEMNQKESFISYSKVSKDISTLRQNNEDATSEKLEFITKDDKEYTIQIEPLR